MKEESRKREREKAAKKKRWVKQHSIEASKLKAQHQRA